MSPKTKLCNQVCEMIGHKRVGVDTDVLSSVELILLVSYLNITKDLAKEVRQRMENLRAKGRGRKRKNVKGV